VNSSVWKNPLKGKRIEELADSLFGDFGGIVWFVWKF